MQLARSIMQSESVTSIDLSGNEFSARVIVEFLRAIQFNSILQEFKLTINKETLSQLPENGKNIKNYNKF